MNNEELRMMEEGRRKEARRTNEEWIREKEEGTRKKEE